MIMSEIMLTSALFILPVLHYRGMTVSPLPIVFPGL